MRRLAADFLQKAEHTRPPLPVGYWRARGPLVGDTPRYRWVSLKARGWALGPRTNTALLTDGRFIRGTKVSPIDSWGGHFGPGPRPAIAVNYWEHDLGDDRRDSFNQWTEIHYFDGYLPTLPTVEPGMTEKDYRAAALQQVEEQMSRRFAQVLLDG